MVKRISISKAAVKPATGKKSGKAIAAPSNGNKATSKPVAASGNAKKEPAKQFAGSVKSISTSLNAKAGKDKIENIRKIAGTKNEAIAKPGSAKNNPPKKSTEIAGRKTSSAKNTATSKSSQKKSAPRESKSVSNGGSKNSAARSSPQRLKEKLNTVTPSGKKDQTFFELVFEVARQIPKGRVTSYGAIAAALGTRSSSRMVGWAMNLAGGAKPKVPAHRVVNRIGMLSGKHHFATPTHMQELLEKEGVKVKDDKVVDFNRLFWDPMDLGD